jgi:peroxiredoxin
MRERIDAKSGSGAGRLLGPGSVGRAALAGLTLLAALWLQPVATLRADDKAAAKAAAPAPRREQALPRLAGPKVGGGEASTDLFRKRRGVLFIFASTDSGAGDVAKIAKRLAGDAAQANIALLGIDRDDDVAAGERFVKEQGLAFPVLLDTGYALSTKLGLRRGSSAIFVVDGEGYVIEQLGVAAGVDPELVERVLREALYLPTKALAGRESTLGVAPPAPDFTLAGLAESDPGTSLAKLKGDVVLVIFFLHTCPHCHDGLRFLKKLRAELKRDDFHVIPISLQMKPFDVAAMQKDLALDFPLYLDPDSKALRSYGAGTAVPEFFLLDRQHRVVAHHSGMEPRVEALLSTEIRKTLGLPTPILLARGAYSGEEACRVCHTAQHDTWSVTAHAYAFETLVQHGSDRNAECLRCHTVGFGEKGGYDPALRQSYLEGVQCESCHGRGGPHQSPGFAKAGYESACNACHTPQHSLQFSFAERLPLVSHASNQQFAKLSIEERRKLLERRDKRERQLFKSAEHVGSQRCAECHTKEFERWKGSPHATAFGTLEKAGKANDAKCQACHTTGFGQTGGFSAANAGPALRGVGCESCHGPGGDHVGADADRRGTILALTDKCDSCVVLQICGSCHDDANDPGFEFEVLDKIDRQRHGFRDKPKPTAAPGGAE